MLCRIEVVGEGANLVVHFTKKEGAPVRYIGGDNPADAAAVRELDLQKKFHLGASELTGKIGLTQPKARALRTHPGIDEDAACHHVFEFGSPRISCFLTVRSGECAKHWPISTSKRCGGSETWSRCWMTLISKARLT